MLTWGVGLLDQHSTGLAFEVHGDGHVIGGHFNYLWLMWFGHHLYRLHFNAAVRLHCGSNRAFAFAPRGATICRRGAASESTD